jgi:hypothetical protein
LRERWHVPGKRLGHYTAEKVLKLAQKGNVLIRGWGACVLLRDVPHVARVRICAPIELRERRVLERRSLKDKALARRRIDRNDAAHTQMVRSAFGVNRETPLLYDLVLNTERLSTEVCVKLIRDLVESPDLQETDWSQTILDDRALEARILVKLSERFTSGTGVSRLQAIASGGGVVLKGVAIHTSFAAEAARIVCAIEGVKSLRNRIEIVRGPTGL